jgi:hypothetical protein
MLQTLPHVLEFKCVPSFGEAQPAANVAHQSAVRTDFEAVSSVLLDWDGPFHSPLRTSIPVPHQALHAAL